MKLLSIAHYTAFLLYIGLIIFILIKNPKALQNRVCALLMGCFTIWSLASSFIYAAVSLHQATLWLNVASFGGYSFASIYLWFSHILNNNDQVRRKWFFYLVIFLTPALFIYQQWAGNLAYLTKQTYGWAVIWPPTLWSYLFYSYYISFVISSLWRNASSIKKAKFYHEKKQIQLIIIWGSITLILATINDLSFPFIKAVHIPQMGSIITLLWAGGITYAITKYKLLVPTPAYAASDILATMSDSLILIGPDGKLIEANTATLKLLGYSREELIRVPVEILLPSTEASFLNEIELLEYLSQKNTFNNYHIYYRTKSGDNIPVSISGSVLRDQDGNLIGVVGVARDLRELLRLQENERAYIVEKVRAQALQERAHELQEAYNKLKTIQTQLIQSEKMAAVGQLAGGVAHEINNPLGVILGFAQSIVKRISDSDPLFLPLKSIEREAIRCKKLAGDLLTFSRAGKTQAEIIDINTMIEETLSLIATQTQVKSIEIIKDYGRNLPQITANKNQLQQAIMNLCNNAIDAMPDGGRLTIGAGNNETHIEIVISDNGHGMTEEVKKHLFEPFFTTKEVGKGTGLGLSLCYEIIWKHHGIIEVESEIGKGSTFKLILPVNEPTPAPISSPPIISA